MRGSTPHGELGAEGELEAETQAIRRRRAPISSSADTEGNTDAECVGESRLAKEKRPSSSGDRSVNPKLAPGEEVASQNRIEHQDAILGDDIEADWIRFDVQRILRVLCLGNHAQCQLT